MKHSIEYNIYKKALTKKNTFIKKNALIQKKIKNLSLKFEMGKNSSLKSCNYYLNKVKIRNVENLSQN